MFPWLWRLHDIVAHTLTEVNVQAAAAERLDPGEARTALERIEQTSHTAIGELRASLGVLRAPHTAAAPRAPTPGLDDIGELVARARDGGLDIRLHTHGAVPARISEATALAAYRIVQESLTNARRHSPGAAITVNLRFDTTCLAVTVDNSPGVPANGPPAQPGVGITGMRERAEAIGGRLDAGPTTAGFHVQAELPYQPAR